jgi:hypothetical protein
MVVMQEGEEARTSTSPPLQDAEALFKEARQRERRRRMAWIGVIAVAALVISLIVALVGASSSSPRVMPTASTGGPSPKLTGGGMPSEIVAWSNAGTIEVMSAHNGHVIRTLAPYNGEGRGISSLAVSISGILYFDETTRGKHGLPVAVINRVPVSGGAVRQFAQGCDPAVSPDGRFLAYVSGLAACTPGYAAPEAITVTNLVTGQRRSWRSSPWATLDSLSWSSDSRYLSLHRLTGHPPEYVNSYLILDRTARPGSLRVARLIPLPNSVGPDPLPGDVAWVGFLGSSKDGLEGVGEVTSGSGVPVKLVAVDGSSGRVLGNLASLPNGTFNGGGGGPIDGTVSTDPTGKFMLLVGSGDGPLYRWTVGGDQPTLIADGVFGGVWVPNGA